MFLQIDKFDDKWKQSVKANAFLLKEPKTLSYYHLYLQMYIKIFRSLRNLISSPFGERYEVEGSVRGKKMRLLGDSDLFTKHG